VAVADPFVADTVVRVTSTAASEIHDALTADPVGAAALETARGAGAWTAGLYSAPIARRGLRADLATASDLALAEEHLFWASELGRLTELASALSSRVDLAVTRSKQLRAKVRTEIRAASNGKPPSQATLDDAAECHAEVLTAEQQLGRVRLLAAHASAAKEATAAYVSALSREITLRGDAKRARLG
jgi:hypothetical protein